MSNDKRRQALALALMGITGWATAPSLAWAEAPKSGPILDLRLRNEWVDDDAFARDGRALTLRTHAGWRQALGEHWTAAFTVENTGHVGDERYNSTANGKTSYPTIADPDNTELSQAWLAWAPNDATRVTAGRQRLNYGNQRYIGASAWRQNDQTFDALDVSHRTGNGWDLRYSYLDRVQRVFGDENPNPAMGHWQLDSHLLNVGHALGPGQLTAYAYLIDNQTLSTSSHRDLGLRYALRQEKKDAAGWFLNLELAKQDDYAGGSAFIDAHYELLEGGLLWRGNTFKAGKEVLSGDGTYGFQTPLATLHAFNGWADKFLSTPVDGLDDMYLGWNRKFGRVEAVVTWHDYRSDHGSIDLGSEWDASLGFAPDKHWLLLAKFAGYNAGRVGKDVAKGWLSVEYSY